MIPENTQNELKQLFNDLKVVLFGESKEKFAMSGMLPDGSKVIIDGNEPQVGVAVITESADGKQAPIADGEYELTIGDKKIKINCVGGLITEVGEEPVAPAAEETPAPTEQPMNNENPTSQNQPSQMPKEITKRIEEIHVFTSEKFTAFESELKSINEKLETLKAENEALKSEKESVKVEFAKVEKKVEEILNTPAEKPTHKPSEFDLNEWRKKQGLI